MLCGSLSNISAGSGGDCFGCCGSVGNVGDCNDDGTCVVAIALRCGGAVKTFICVSGDSGCNCGGFTDGGAGTGSYEHSSP